MKVKYAAFAVAGLLLGSSLAQAEEGLIRVRGIMSKVDYTLDYEDSSGAELTGSSQFDAVGFGLTYASPSGFYVDYKQTDSQDATHDWYRPTYPSLPMKREDKTLTFGAVDADLFGFYLAIQSGKTTREAYASSLQKRRIFDTTGLVFGVSKGFATGIGTFGINGGVGVMAGKLTIDTATTSTTYDADASFAYSLGASYSYNITKNVFVGLDAKIQGFSMDFQNTSPTFTYYETMKTVSANLGVQF